MRVDGLGANEEERLRVLNRIVLKTPNQKLYPSLSGIQLNHAPNQHSPFCTLKCGDLKAAAQEMAGLEADLNHCREELEGR